MHSFALNFGRQRLDVAHDLVDVERPASFACRYLDRRPTERSDDDEVGSCMRTVNREA